MAFIDIDSVDNFEDWLAAYDAITEMLNENFGTTIGSGIYTPASTTITDALRDLMESALNINDAGIFADPADHEYVGQFFDSNAAFVSCANGDLVYKHSGGSYYQAQSGVTNFVVGMADITNGKVIGSGFVTFNHGNPAGSRLYLSTTAGEMTTTAGPIPIGWAISTTVVLLDFGYRRLADELAPFLTSTLNTLGNKIMSSSGNLYLQAPAGQIISFLIDSVAKASLDEDGLLTAIGFAGDGSQLTNLGNWSRVTTNTTTVAGGRYLLVAGVATVMTLPISPVLGDTVQICDADKKATTYTLTVARNGQNIESAASNYVITVDGDSIEFVYVDSTIGWKRTSQNATLYV